MRAIYLSFACAIILMACNSANKPADKTVKEETLSVYDSVLAQEYGADPYGMKSYVMALLYSGDNKSLDSSEAAEVQAAHLENMSKLAQEGTLVLAGPFLEGDSLRGIFIFDVSSLEEAEKLANSDPAIQAGVLKMKLRRWYGSAGVVGISDLHKKLSKKSITE